MSPTEAAQVAAELDRAALESRIEQLDRATLESRIEQVAAPAVVATEVVAAEVAAVDASLEEHREESEERHVEILEGESCLERKLDQLLATNNQLIAMVTAGNAAQLAVSQSMLTTLESMKLSQASTPITPVAEAAIVEVNPEAIPKPAEENGAVEDRGAKTKHVRRVI